MASADEQENQSCTDSVDPIRQAIVMLEHRIRNLRKRKRKIETYRDEHQNGKELNSDQIVAIIKLEELQHTLDFTSDLCKELNTIAFDAIKQLRKKAKKEEQEQANRQFEIVKEILIVQDVLHNLSRADVRKDFLTGRNGAVRLTEDDLRYLDEICYKVFLKHGNKPASFEEQLQQSAEHLLAIVNAKSMEIAGITYAKLKDLIAIIHACGYFESLDEIPSSKTGQGKVEDIDHMRLPAIAATPQGEECKRRWTTLRHSVLQNEKLNNTNNNQENTECSNDPSSLPLANDKVSVTNAPEVEKIATATELLPNRGLYSPGSTASPDHTGDHRQSAPTTFATKPSTMGRERLSKQPIPSSIITLLQLVENCRADMEAIHNEIIKSTIHPISFFENMEQIVMNFPPFLQAKVKMEIFQIIKWAKYYVDNQQCMWSPITPENEQSNQFSLHSFS